MYVNRGGRASSLGETVALDVSRNKVSIIVMMYPDFSRSNEEDEEEEEEEEEPAAAPTVVAVVVRLVCRTTCASLAGRQPFCCGSFVSEG